MKTAILAAAAAMLLASPALARPLLDANSDGKVSFEEFRSARTTLIMAADLDQDGRIEPIEVDAVSATRNETSEGVPDPHQVFALLDTDKDGAVTRQEVDTMVARRFRMLDRNGDGSLSPAEREAWRDPVGHK